MSRITDWVWHLLEVVGSWLIQNWREAVVLYVIGGVLFMVLVVVWGIRAGREQRRLTRIIRQQMDQIEERDER